ncbi:MAG: lacA [Acidimicrobiales bacterium]|nr:lacA [Acidimicrobiales bacterium]
MHGGMIGRIRRRLRYSARVARDRRSKRTNLRDIGSVGPNCHITGEVYISAPGKVVLGENVHIGTGAFIRAEGGLTIGDNTHISRNLLLYTMNHEYAGSRLPYDDSKIVRPVVIGRNVWVGMNVCIAPGSEIGDGAIIGMGTVVSGVVPPMAIIGSQPWRVLGQRDEEHYHRLDGEGRYGAAGGKPYDAGDTAPDAQVTASPSQ